MSAPTLHPVVEAGGETLVLLPGRAAWWPRQRTLLVADVHLGKATSFRRLGVPVPEGTTQATLGNLASLLAETGAERLVVLGDLVHARRGLGPALLDAVAAWRRRHAGLALTLVVGNHDARSGVLPAEWRVETVGPLRAAPGLLLAHEPADAGAQGAAASPDARGAADAAAAPYVLAGHLHPCVVLHGRAGQRLRLPCFHFGPRVGVLPAFGAFTGMHPVQPAEGDRVWMVADGTLHERPRRAAGAGAGPAGPAGPARSAGEAGSSASPTLPAAALPAPSG